MTVKELKEKLAEFDIDIRIHKAENEYEEINDIDVWTEEFYNKMHETFG